MKNQILCHLEGDEGIESEYGKFEIFLSAVGEKDAYGRFTKYKIVATPIDEKNAKKYKTRMASTSNPLIWFFFMS